MKIGGLTWWRNNYGSILQAYAMQETLDEIKDVDYEIICQYGKKVASIDNFVDKLKRKGVIDTFKRVFWKFCLPGLRERNINIQRFVDAKLHISQQQFTEETIERTNDIYDGFLCGSDQIWNPALNPVSSMYWLGFAYPEKLKFSYAPSVGVNEVTEKQAAIIRRNLSSFSAISCREETGTQLLNQILSEEKCVTVLDPTLMVKRSIWDRLCPHCQFDKPYIFAYLLRGTKKQRQIIEQFAQKNRLQIVTMPFLDTERIELYDFIFGDVKYWDATPDGFVSTIRYADYVFTDSFHCMIFSCLYHRNFFAFPKIGNAQLNRITDLHNMFCIQDRMFSDMVTVEEIESIIPIDWNKVDDILAVKREQSYRFLRDAVKQ